MAARTAAGGDHREIRVELEELQRGEAEDENEGTEKPAGTGGNSSTWERVVAAVSALVVGAAIGFMVYEGVAVPRTPPDIRIEVEDFVNTGAAHLVRFRAWNRGNETAVSLLVEGELYDASGTVETSEVVIDYVPAGSKRRAGLLFSRNPREYSIQIRAKGFDTP